MNWGALGQMTGWLPGAAVGGLVGGLLALWSFDGMATADQCSPGSSALLGPCVRLAGFTFQGFLAFAVAAAAVGGIIGAVVLAGYTAMTKTPNP